jgi:hypothetical protein
LARLPLPGSDNGTWGEILNDYLSVSHNADGTLKFGTTAGTAAQGDDSRITGAEQAANKGVAGGYAALDGSVRVPIAQLPTGTSSSQIALGNHAHAALQGLYPLSAYGFFTASAVIEAFTSNSTASNFMATRIFVPAGKPIVGIGTVVRSVGTLNTGGTNGFAIYDDSGGLVASTVSDDNLWLSTGWQTKTFTSTIAAQASDRFVYACMMVNGYSANPGILYNVLGNGVNNASGGGYGVPNHRRFFYNNGVASWPASFNPASYGLDPSGFLPLIALA